jgi:hypothetical protein
MKKSASVTLTVLAAVGSARAQQAPNPCQPGTFNATACRVAVKNRGYCSGGAWQPQQFQKYPYYYDHYRAYSSAGGIVAAAQVETCRLPGHPVVSRGGFGAIGVAAHSNAGS